MSNLISKLTNKANETEINKTKLKLKAKKSKSAERQDWFHVISHYGNYMQMPELPTVIWNKYTDQR